MNQLLMNFDPPQTEKCKRLMWLKF